MGEIVNFPSNGGVSQGYLALPASGSGPAVIVIQEWWDLVPHITALADRFAKAGFVALAPDLYDGTRSSEPDEAGKLLMGRAMDHAAKDIAAAANYLVERPEVTGGVGAVGFCMGGSLALWSATQSEHIVATVGFYPGLPWDRMSPQWSNYAGKATVVHCSAADGTSAAVGVQTAKTAIEAAGGQVVLYDYPDTRHAFFNDDRPEVYNAEAAKTAWARTLELFRSRLS